MASSTDRPHLPYDVILDEILSRTSLDTVAASRAVCKRLNEATHEWSFSDKLHRRTNTFSGFLLQTLSQGKYNIRFSSSTADDKDKSPKELSLAFLPVKVEMIGAVTKQGLFLCLCQNQAHYRDIFYIVCKPTTKQWRKLPRPKTRYFTKGMAMTVLASNPREFRYKIARFSKTKNGSVRRKSKEYLTTRCEIFDSATWAWRSLPEDISVSDREIVWFHQMVSAAGFLYALTNKKRVFALDWERETWELVALPERLSEADTFGKRKLKLVEFEGKLGLVCLMDSETVLEIWVFESVAQEGLVTRVWNRRKRVNIESCSHFFYPLAMPWSDVVAFKTNSGDIEFLRFGSCNLTKKHVVKVIKYYGERIGDICRIESDRNFVRLKKQEQVVTRMLVGPVSSARGTRDESPS